MKKLEDVFIWQQARSLNQEIHQLIPILEQQGEWELIRQIKKAGGSVMDNIAEGFGRGGNREFIQFLSIARASCAELRSQLTRVQDLGIAPDQSRSFELLAIISSGCLKLIRYLQSLQHKGPKFKP